MPQLYLFCISARFQSLSQSQRYIIYVLLTRSPLTVLLQSVRLACIRHAASVHPEPGSNSPFDLTLFYTLSSVILLKFIDVVLFLFVSQRTTQIVVATTCFIIIYFTFANVNKYFYFFHIFFKKNKKRISALFI